MRAAAGETESGRPRSWRRGHEGFQLGEAGGEVVYLRLLARDGALLFLDFVEEHGVDEVVAHGLRCAVLVEDDELWGHLGNLFGHQAVLPGMRGIELWLVIEGHGPQLHQDVALVAHARDALLEPPRGRCDAKLAGGVDEDGRAAGEGGSRNSGDEG